MMVIGGAEVYTLLFAQADRLYITEIDASFEGDAWFPDFERHDWQQVERQHCEPDDKNIYPHTFILLDRKR